MGSLARPGIVSERSSARLRMMLPAAMGVPAWRMMCVGVCTSMVAAQVSRRIRPEMSMLASRDAGSLLMSART